MVTFAMTVALVKAMDIMGLVPLRWAINILITPRVQCARIERFSSSLSSLGGVSCVVCGANARARVRLSLTQIARYVGPHADKLFHAIKGLIKRKKPPTQGS